MAAVREAVRDRLGFLERGSHLPWEMLLSLLLFSPYPQGEQIKVCFHIVVVLKPN